MEEVCNSMVVEEIVKEEVETCSSMEGEEMTRVKVEAVTCTKKVEAVNEWVGGMVKVEEVIVSEEMQMVVVRMVKVEKVICRRKTVREMGMVVTCIDKDMEEMMIKVVETCIHKVEVVNYKHKHLQRLNLHCLKQRE
ncbi:hypothetical protein Peur_059025 [Populus x canadensis]